MSTMIATLYGFPGFYYSYLAQELEHVEDREAEWLADREIENGIHEAERLSKEDFADLLWKHADYQTAHTTLAKDYAETFLWFASETLGFDLGGSFESMTSPRFYNFETDRVFLELPEATVLKLFQMSAEAAHLPLTDFLKANFTSYDGFISHYSNDINDWLEKPLVDWDHNEVGALLSAVLQARLEADFETFDEFAFRIFENMFESEVFYTAFSEAVDWEGLEYYAEGLRTERREELEEDDQDRPQPRCENTQELPL